MSRILLASFILLSFTLIAQADLPVHCLKHQIVGLWSVELTEPVVTDDPNVASCGHKRPDDPASSYLSGVDAFNPVTTTIMLQLNNDSTAIKIHDGQSTTGNWTLIYDQGFDIVFDDERFTNFFYHFPKESTDENSHSLTFRSNCGKTTIGWYHRSSNNEKACWRAQKILAEGERKEDLIVDSTGQVSVLQPRPIPKKTSSLIQEQSSASSNKKKRHSLRATEGLETSAPVTEKAPKYTKDFTNHSEIVHHLNLLETKSWTAEVPKGFESKTLGELNEMAGTKVMAEVRANAVMEDVSDLPKEFDWSHLLGEVRAQKQCGSCYAIATIQMLEARIKLKHNETVRLSVQHALDCAYYNQGCRGGYSYLVGLFASQYELVPEECSPYLARNGECGTCDVSKLDKVYKATNFK